jgi:hypothetical protein
MGRYELSNRTVPTIDEIRAAMNGQFWDAGHDEHERDVLAACVRELYELVDNTEQILMDAYSGGIDLDSWHGFYDDVQYAVDRYRAALEGGDGETQ